MSGINETRFETNANRAGGNATRVEGRDRAAGSASRASQSNHADPGRQIDWKRVIPNGFRGYQFREYLGGGGEAFVILLSNGPDMRALKLYRNNLLKPELEKNIERLSRNHKEQFIQIFESGYDPELQSHGYSWYELQQYAAGGNLKSLLANREEARKYFTTEYLKNLISQVNEALAILEKNGIVHKDLKPANILIRSKKPLRIAISDFGIATALVDNGQTQRTQANGTLYYSAPEVKLGRASPKSDFWSLGIIVYEILTGRTPYEGLNNDDDVLMQIIENKIKISFADLAGKVDDSFILLLKGLLTSSDREKRWGHDEVRRWLNGARDIPTYFDESFGIGDNAGNGETFLLVDGTKFLTVADFARNCANGPEKWRSGAGALLRGNPGLVYQELLKNRWTADADKVNWLLSENHSPEETFFRFIYTFAPELSFRYMGKEMSLNNLYACLLRMINKEAMRNEDREIFNAMGNGTLARLHTVYMELTGKRGKQEEKLHAFLERLRGINIDEQRNLFDAVNKWQSSQIGTRSLVKYSWPLAAALAAAAGSWLLQSFVINTFGFASVVGNIFTLGKLRILEGNPLTLFRLADIASMALFAVAGCILWQDWTRMWSFKKNNISDDLPDISNLGSISKRLNKDPGFYKMLLAAASLLLLLSPVAAISLTAYEDIETYALAGNKKALDYLRTHAPSTPFVGQLIGDLIPVRQKPDTKAQAIVRVTKGSTMSVLDKDSSGKWYKVAFSTKDRKDSAKTGWINAQTIAPERVAHLMPAPVIDSEPSQPQVRTPTPQPQKPAATKPQRTPQNKTQTSKKTTANDNAEKKHQQERDAQYANLVADGRSLKQAGRYEEALNRYQRAQALKDTPDMRSEIGNLQTRVADQKAKGNRASEFEKEGDLLFNKGNFKEAKAAYSKSFSVSKNAAVKNKMDVAQKCETAARLANDGDKLMAQGKHNDAIRKYQQSIAAIELSGVSNKLRAAISARDEAKNREAFMKGVITPALNTLFKKMK
jgi:serine/threonine protein kinase/predicted negative regulator of RcsB-dependent stress response